MKLDLLRIAEARPSLKEAADTLRSDIDLLCEDSTVPVIHTSKLAESIHKIGKVTQQNTTITSAPSSPVGKRKHTHDDQTNSIHVKKNKKAYVFHPPTLTPSVSINKPTFDNVDATLLKQHYYVKLSDAHTLTELMAALKLIPNMTTIWTTKVQIDRLTVSRRQ